MTELLATEQRNGAETAFPQPSVMGPNGDFHYGTPGLTKRELFAAMAMQGFCANPAVFAGNAQNGWMLVNCDEKQLATYCLKLAEAQLSVLAESAT